MRCGQPGEWQIIEECFRAWAEELKEVAGRSVQDWGSGREYGAGHNGGSRCVVWACLAFSEGRCEVLDERAEEVVPEENYRCLLMAIYTTCDDFSAAVFSYIQIFDISASYSQFFIWPNLSCFRAEAVPIFLIRCRRWIDILLASNTTFQKIGRARP